MTSPVFVGIVLAFVICVFLLRMLWLRVGAKLCRIPNTTWGRVALAVFIATIVDYGVFAADFFFIKSPTLSSIAIVMGVNHVALFIVIKLILRASMSKAVGAGAIQLLLLALSAIPLVLIARWTVMQTHFMPTGSSAPTLYGRHAEQVCSACGFRFAISLDQTPVGMSRKRALLTCPNCGQPQADQSVETEPDHILVDKTTLPKRWELMMYRNPRDPEYLFVHRLVGLPGEQIDLVHGDVFIDGKRVAKPPERVSDLWFQINDSRYGMEGGDATPTWRPEKSNGLWTRTGGTWKCAAAQAQPQRLQLVRHIDDSLPYNQAVRSPTSPFHYVGDVKIELDLAAFSGPGGIGFEWSFDGYRVTGKIDADGGLSLVSGEQGAAGRLEHSLALTRHVAMGLRDGRAFILDGKRMAASMVLVSEDLEAIQLRSEPIKACEFELIADRCDVELRRIGLYRDVYYRDEEWRTNAARSAMAWSRTPFTLGSDEYFVLGDNSAMSMDSRYADQTYVGGHQPGTVPRELVVGTARLIHWPPQRWHVLD
jgi:signal peptidase I